MFQAKYQNRIVNYPSHSATYIVEQKPRRGKFKMIANKSDIERALSSFDRSRRAGHTTRLTAAVNGKMRSLLEIFQ